MDDLSGNKKRKGEGSIIGVVAVILIVCIFIDVKIGLGAGLGAVAGYFARKRLKDGSSHGKRMRIKQFFWIRKCCVRISPSRKICLFPMQCWTCAAIS